MENKKTQTEKSIQPQTTSALSQFSPEKIEVIKNTVAKGATDDELEMFLTLASRYKLDPFAKEIWFIKRVKKEKKPNGKWDYPRLRDGSIDYTDAETVIMTSRDGYLKIAQNHPDFVGIKSMEVRENDKFVYDAIEDKIAHQIGSNRGKITGAWARCRRKGRDDAFILIDFNEYKSAVGNSNTWNKYPSAMIRKVAEVIVLKQQFGISGLVTEEEMHSDFSLNNVLMKGKALPDPNKNKKQATNQKRQEQQKDKQSKEAKNKEWVDLAASVRDKREIIGIDPEQMRELCRDVLKIDSDPRKWDLKTMRMIDQYLSDWLAKIEEPIDLNDTESDADALADAFEEHEKNGQTNYSAYQHSSV